MFGEQSNSYIMTMTHLYGKVIPAFSQAPCHEDIWWIGGIALGNCNINLAVGEQSASHPSSLSTGKMPHVATG